MYGIDFSNVAGVYEKTALVQNSASKVLLDLLGIKEKEDVLDLGCGPGNITVEIAKRTKGEVYGVDMAAGMIEKAGQRERIPGNLSFAVKDAAHLGFSSTFDVIFCNSAFQWFTKPDDVLRQCFKALKPFGRIGIQAPATRNYCPNFVAAEEKIRNNSVTGGVFSGYRSPWFFLENVQGYAQLFARNGFSVRHCEIVREENLYTVDQAYQIYQSGAENGYLNQDYYQVILSPKYIEMFRMLVRQTIAEQAREDGLVPIVFNRIYLVAEKSE